MRRFWLLWVGLLFTSLLTQAQSWPSADQLCMGTAGDTGIFHAGPGAIEPNQCGPKTAAFVRRVTNDTSTGTTLNSLAKVTGAPSAAVLAGTGDNKNGVVIGIVVANAGKSGTAYVTFAGAASCNFDGSTTAGDFVTVSTSVAGDCTDFGSTVPADGSQLIGRVFDTNTGAGLYRVHLNGETSGSAGSTNVFTGAPTPNTAASFGLGTAALPWSNLILGTGATNVYTITPSSLSAARALTVADPGGAGTFAYVNNTVVQTVSGVQAFTGNRVNLTSDFTSANASGLQLITGLSIALNSGFSGSLSFHCGLRYSQATASAGDQFGIGVLVTAPTRADAGGLVSTNATTVQQGFMDNLTSTTPTAIVTFTPAVTTELQATLDGTVQVAAGGTTLNWYVTNGTAANVIVVKAGSFCTIM